jgi:hypothetical protein
LRWDAKQLFERSVTEGVRLTADGSAVELDEGELIEDDGPAAVDRRPAHAAGDAPRRAGRGDEGRGQRQGR